MAMKHSFAVSIDVWLSVYHQIQTYRDKDLHPKNEARKDHHYFINADCETFSLKRLLNCWNLIFFYYVVAIAMEKHYQIISIKRWVSHLNTSTFFSSKSYTFRHKKIHKKGKSICNFFQDMVEQTWFYFQQRFSLASHRKKLYSTLTKVMREPFKV